jgi:hypothetical protein
MGVSDLAAFGCVYDSPRIVPQVEGFLPVILSGGCIHGKGVIDDHHDMGPQGGHRIAPRDLLGLVAKSNAPGEGPYILDALVDEFGEKMDVVPSFRGGKAGDVP